jgi:hypothetical protein
MGMVCWVIGNILVAYTWFLSARNTGEKLALAALLSPLYWMLMAAAAAKAWTQLFTAPTFWEKTQHGLDVADDTDVLPPGVTGAQHQPTAA